MSLCIQENILDAQTLYKLYDVIALIYWNIYEIIVINIRNNMGNKIYTIVYNHYA